MIALTKSPNLQGCHESASQTPLLTSDEVARTFSHPVAAEAFPPILTPAQFARLVDLTGPDAVYHALERGLLGGSWRRRGKHVLIWRDRAFVAYLERPLKIAADAPIGLTAGEIRDAFSTHELIARFPPSLSPESLATLLHLSRSTLYHWIGLERLNGAIKRRGHRTIVLRDRAIEIIFNGETWSNYHEKLVV